MIHTRSCNAKPNFYPRSPCGERPTTIITICIALKFLSTLSLRRATRVLDGSKSSIEISIHALLAESDFHYFDLSGVWCDFYPRSPCGERQRENAGDMYRYQFLSTLSLRRATARSASKLGGMSISIHALLAESDGIIDIINNIVNNFYPRSPCGERPAGLELVKADTSISIHALLAESDREPTALRTPHHKFLSTLSLRRATPNGQKHINSRTFLSTLSLRRATGVKIASDL